MRWWRNRRLTLIDWLCCAAIAAAAAGLVCYEWPKSGPATWYYAYLKWEKLIGLPDWWPL